MVDLNCPSAITMEKGQREGREGSGREGLASALEFKYNHTNTSTPRRGLLVSTLAVLQKWPERAGPWFSGANPG